MNLEHLGLWERDNLEELSRKLVKKWLTYKI